MLTFGEIILLQTEIIQDGTDGYIFLEDRDLEVIQYTGETDDKNNKIYRLDIVEVLEEIKGEIRKSISLVEYVEGAYVLSLRQEHDTYLGAMTNGENVCIEKIGNKYEDPELLEDGK